MKNGSKLARSTGSSLHLLRELARRARVAARGRVGLALRVQPRVGRGAVHRRGGDQLAVVVGDEDRDRAGRIRDDVVDDRAGPFELHRAIVIRRTAARLQAAMAAVAIRGHDVPGRAAEAERPAAAPRGDDHVAAGARPGRVPLPALDRADPALARAPAPCSRSRSRSRKQHVLMWPASALLTGNGVAFILRVPGTQHGDWWSLRGWWIFVGTAGGLAALEVRDQVARRARLQPVEHRARRSASSILGRGRADPLDFWWGPMSWWMVLALAIIVTGGFAILRGSSCSASRSLLGCVRRRDRRARRSPGTR